MRTLEARTLAELLHFGRKIEVVLAGDGGGARRDAGHARAGHGA